MRTRRAMYVHARLAPVEREALVRLCDYEHLRLSELVRWLVREAAQKHGLWPVQPQPEGETTVQYG